MTRLHGLFLRTFLLVATLCLTALPALAQRLPGGVTPTHYALWFAPDLEQETFRGRETIAVTLAAPATSITLHAAEITFGEVTVKDTGGTQTARVTLDEKTETATFTVPRAVSKGPATIQVTYAGILNDKLRGFYLSRANGRKYAVSQMEATDARRAFPSFDEPAYKATFAISLMIDAADHAISNGRQVSDTPGPEPGKHTVTFAPTPKMSTYLVALLVGDFVCRSGSADGIPIRVCSTPDKLGLTAFALTAAEQQVAFFNRYFGIRYPYDKLDIIGVPDFAAGAMENAGAITFRERMLLADEATASVGVRTQVALVVAHELAHQWFGDLVTMKWWDDIWLNEGFATWAANKPVAAWKPEWKLDVAAAGDTQTALGLDVLRSTRAIHTDVSTPAQINEVFDPIAYEKTAGVLEHDRGLRRPRGLPPGGVVVPREVRHQQRRWRGLLDGDDAGHREARQSHHEELRRSARRARAVGEQPLRCRRHRSHGPPAALRGVAGHRRRRRRREGLGGADVDAARLREDGIG